MSDWKDEFVQKRWSKEDEFYNSGPVDPCQELREQNGTLRETIARLEREKGMLVAVAEASKPVCDFSMQLIHDNLEPKIAELNRVLVAAIDGGALEVE